MENQNSSKVLKVSQPQELSACKQSQDKLDGLLAGCFALQKMYGRSSESMEVVTTLFHSMLGKYPAKKVICAFETWLERSQEFPTPADIVSLIRRNGKPPLGESRYIAISKKDYAIRTPEENCYVREYEETQDQSSWNDLPEEKQQLFNKENITLRQRIQELEKANAKAWAEVKRLRAYEAIAAKVYLTPQDKIQRTIEAMRQSGAPEVDIQAFKEKYTA